MIASTLAVPGLRASGSAGNRPYSDNHGTGPSARSASAQLSRAF